MPVRQSERARSIEPFLAMDVMDRAFAMERDGRRVIHLEIGEPDFPPPRESLEACARALRAGQTRYSESLGLPELREAIAADHLRRDGVRVDPGRILVTNGTSPAMLLVFSLLVDPGDEVILGTPHYPCYPNFIRFCGATPVLVPTDPDGGYHLDPDAVRARITPSTRAIVVATPANPTGAVQDQETLRTLAELGPPLVVDQIYDGLVYDELAPTSALRLSDELFVLDGFSKRYAMTGFRLGYAIVPRGALRSLQAMQQNLFISANRFVQHAGGGALAHGAATLAAMRSAYRRRRGLLVEGLRKLGFRVPAMPRGAFYVFADARAFGDDSVHLAFELLERAAVAVTPGVDFGAAGEGWLRFCYAASDEQLEEALRRLEGALATLP